MCGSLFRGLLEQQRQETERMKETKQHYFYTPGSMSKRAAGKLKKKKEEHPEKCFWGTFLFSKCISSKRLPFSSFNQLLPSYPRNAVFISLHLDLSPPSSSLSPLRELVWSTAESRRTADLSVSISPLHSPLSSQSCHVSKESSRSSLFPVTRSPQPVWPKMSHGNGKLKWTKIRVITGSTVLTSGG